MIFDQERAAAYDSRFDKLSPLRDALHLQMRAVLADLPEEARILCVGAGTGAELLYLAQQFPTWRFTAVEPAEPMLNICRQRVAAAGIAERCTFHAGYLDSLPATDAFDAATCLLVSHFILEKMARRQFFSQIASRLCTRGVLINSDLVADKSAPGYAKKLAVWLRMMTLAELPPEELESLRIAYDHDVALLPPQQLESMLVSSGFDTPVLFYQSMLIHGWYSHRVS